MSYPCFVFGSNLHGVHGAGAAAEAKRNWGALQGCGFGLQGNSYAIPTKATPSQTLSLEKIEEHVNTFLQFAETHPDILFILTPIGCGLAGYSPHQIAPMFEDAPKNVYLPKEFVEELLQREYFLAQGFLP